MPEIEPPTYVLSTRALAFDMINSALQAPLSLLEIFAIDRQQASLRTALHNQSGTMRSMPLA
jgi:hypothetical protein